MRRLLLLLPILLVALAALAVFAVTCEDGDGPAPMSDQSAQPRDEAAGIDEQDAAAPRRRHTADTEPAELESTADESVEAEANARHVLVVDAHGRGVPGVVLEFGPNASSRLTDAEGRAPFSDGESLVIYPDGSRKAGRDLPDVGDVVIRLLHAKPLDVRVISGATGEPVDADIAFIVESEHFAIPISEGRRGLDPSPIQAGSDGVWAFRVPDFPRGLVTELPENLIFVESEIATDVERVRVTLVLRESVTIPVRVLDATGQPVKRYGERFLPFTLSSDSWPRRAADLKVDTDGRGEIDRLPFLAGARFELRVGSRAGWTVSSGHVVLEPGVQPEVVIHVPAHPGSMKSEDATPPGLYRTARAPGRGMIGESAAGWVEVCVVGSEGAATAGVRIELVDEDGNVRGTETTNADGVARVRSLTGGTYVARAVTPGFPSDVRRVTIAEGGTGSLTLRRVPGDRFRVRVLDEEGKPVPFAKIGLWVGPADVTHPHIVDGVQELQPYTDALGGITFTGVGALPWSVYAEYGSRKAEMLVTERVGEVVIRLER